MKHFIPALVCGLLLGGMVYGQRTLPLTDLSDFQSQAGNWQIVGSVMMNPNVDVHEHEAPAPQAASLEEVKGKKKKKKKKKAKAPIVVPPPPPKAVEFEGGTGILLNMNTKDQKDHLLSSWEHGDLEFEADVMLPKGSNSGIYLQGRYEVQLFDSWGVKNPSFSDIGGIYRNWENTPGQIYRGKAPSSNPAKAPGLWQHIHILFQAPKFDKAGNKISNAKFVFVDLNGVRIHQHVEVPLPTGGPIEKNEVAKGPLMIQGDHGPVAFKNIRITNLKDPEVSLHHISYTTFEGDYGLVEEFLDGNAEPLSTGMVDIIDCNVAGLEDHYAMVFKGKMKVEEAGDYTFRIPFRGGVVFKVGENTLIDHQRGGSWRDDKAQLKLTAGEYPFELYHYKSSGWMNPGLGLYVSKAGTYEKALHAYDSYPTSKRMVSPIFVDAGKNPRLLRAFLDFEGDRKRRLTHNLAVGDPSGMNYIYDMKRQNLVCMWRGDFINATPMWHDRGDGSFRPRGAALFTFTDQPLAKGVASEAGFQQMSLDHSVKPKGYKIDPKSQHPIFMFDFEGMQGSSQMFADEKSGKLYHKIHVEGQDSAQAISYKLAEGSEIQKMPNGYYAIDGQKYYIELMSKQVALIRKNKGKEELVVELEGKPLKYAVIW
ncbi:MAG: family 16 glycoside hydrolase [Bacteroidota bacterium]